MSGALITYLIALPVCFFVGIMNASAGGGGLISLPVLLLLGLPPHVAVGTNKLQAVMGLLVANYRYFKNGFVHFGLAACTGFCGVLASLVGASMSLMADERILIWLMLGALPIAAFFVFRRKQTDDEDADELQVTPKLLAKSSAVAMAIGFYDGFYGPGAGTFYIIALCAFCGLSMRRSTAQAKFINLVTNIAAMTVFAFHGQIDVPLALSCGACNVIGAWLGSGLVIKNGTAIMKPLIALAFVLLVVKIIVGF